MSRLMIMAGGTGGHIYPAIAVANVLRDAGVEIVWLGTREGLEARVVPDAGYPVEWISIRGLRGKGIKRWIAMPWLLLRALGQTFSIVRRIKPDAMLGMGGFVSGPGAIVARLTARPLIIHEQNAVSGLTNRWLARVATRVLTGFPDTFNGAEHTGNPVREDFVSTEDAVLKAHAQPLRVLVVGGSQGALALNRIVPEAIAGLGDAERPQVRHQCGRDRHEPVRARYAELGIDAEVDEFIDDMAAAYRWADVVVCRSGAMTVAEVAASARPAIFVPYPYAVSDHQRANANYLVERDAALILDESGLEPEGLASVLRDLHKDRSKLTAMSAAALNAARPQATRRVAEICMEVLHA